MGTFGGFFFKWLFNLNAIKVATELRFYFYVYFTCITHLSANLIIILQYYTFIGPPYYYTTVQYYTFIGPPYYYTTVLHIYWPTLLLV